MDKVQQARSLVKAMDDKTFVSFAKELQYAMKWYDNGYGQAQAGMFWNEINEQHGERKGYLTYPRRRDVIVHSPLYDAVREVVRQKEGREVAPDWCGWIGLSSRDDVVEINEAMVVLWRQQYRLFLAPEGMNVTAEQVQRAKETITKHGIEGIFTQEGDLIDIFLQHYGSVTAQQGPSRFRSDVEYPNGGGPYERPDGH